MSDAPFTEKLITSEAQDAAAARARLQTTLAELNPAGGILDTGDGTGRHANKVKKNQSWRITIQTIPRFNTGIGIITTTISNIELPIKHRRKLSLGGDASQLSIG